jgi:hypothetical protein
VSALDPAPDFEADDSFLHAVLGLLVAGEEVRAVLDAEQDVAPVAARPAEDALLYALLGLVRVRTRVTDVVKSWAVDEPSGTSPAAIESSPARLEGLLR